MSEQFKVGDSVEVWESGQWTARTVTEVRGKTIAASKYHGISAIFDLQHVRHVASQEKRYGLWVNKHGCWAFDGANGKNSPIIFDSHTAALAAIPERSKRTGLAYEIHEFRSLSEAPPPAAKPKDWGTIGRLSAAVGEELDAIARKVWTHRCSAAGELETDKSMRDRIAKRAAEPWGVWNVSKGRRSGDCPGNFAEVEQWCIDASRVNTGELFEPRLIADLEKPESHPAVVAEVDRFDDSYFKPFWKIAKPRGGTTVPNPQPIDPKRLFAAKLQKEAMTHAEGRKERLSEVRAKMWNQAAYRSVRAECEALAAAVAEVEKV